jgi:undecaprenyl-diphosphatase
MAPGFTRLGPFVKDLVERPRPKLGQVYEIREFPGGYSFPSGHSLQASVVAVVVVIAAGDLLTGKLRIAVQAAAVGFAVTIGWERVFDGVHWPTDVAGGLLLGILCTVPTWWLIRSFARRWGRPQTTSS